MSHHFPVSQKGLDLSPNPSNIFVHLHQPQPQLVFSNQHHHPQQQQHNFSPHSYPYPYHHHHYQPDYMFQQQTYRIWNTLEEINKKLQNFELKQQQQQQDSQRFFREMSLIREEKEPQLIVHLLDSTLQLLAKRWLDDDKNELTKRSHLSTLELCHKSKLLNPKMTLRDFHYNVDKTKILMNLKNGKFSYIPPKKYRNYFYKKYQQQQQPHHHEYDDDDDYDIEKIQKHIKLTNSQHIHVLDVPKQTYQVEAKDLLKSNTLQKHANSFLSFMNFLTRETNSFIPYITKPKDFHQNSYEKTQSSLIPPDFLQELLVKTKPISYQAYLIIKLIYETGKRVNEILKLTRKQCRLDINQIDFYLSQTKTKELKIIHTSIRDDVKKELLHFIQTNNIPPEDDAPIFKDMTYSKLYHSLIKAWNRIELEKRPNMITDSLRSTFIKEMFAAGRNITEIMSVTGHTKESAVIYHIIPPILKELTPLNPTTSIPMNYLDDEQPQEEIEEEKDTGLLLKKKIPHDQKQAQQNYFDNFD